MRKTLAVVVAAFVYSGKLCRALLKAPAGFFTSMIFEASHA